MAGRKMELLSMTCLGDNVMEKLKQYAQEDVVFIKENKSADAVLVYQFCREFMDWYYQCLKERQKIGIQNALKRKREGNEGPNSLHATKDDGAEAEALRVVTLQKVQS